jgi:hypothetical protein
MVPKMIKYSKFNDIHAVLNKANLLIVKIEEEYKKSLTSQTISDELLVDIKDYLGNLRSALDYLRAKVSKHNFPICKTEKEFENATADLSDEIKNMIKKFQPFQGNDWISWFNTLNNKSKHLTLIPQKRKEQKTMTAKTENVSVTMPIDNPNFSVHQGENCQVSIGGVPVKFTNQGIIPLAQGLQREITTWISFEFDNSNCPELPSNISALPFLKQCFGKVTQAISEIETVIK